MLQAKILLQVAFFWQVLFRLKKNIESLKWHYMILIHALYIQETLNVQLTDNKKNSLMFLNWNYM